MPEADFLSRRVNEWLADRLADVTRTFPLALILGDATGELPQILPKDKVKHCVMGDFSVSRLLCIQGDRVVLDEEWLPFAPECFDAVLIAGGLHWVNDLPGALLQLRHMLKPDGLLLAAMPGPATLQELRQSFAAAEALAGAIRPHIAPFVEVRDAGNLLTRAGFALPVVDSEPLTVTYANPLALLRDLKSMGETNMLEEQMRGILPRALFAQMCEHYQNAFSTPDGRIIATFECIMLTAWAPHISQPKPSRRGSGQVNLAQLFSEH